MSCSVDPKAWGAKNRVTLYPGKVQTWVLAHALTDNPTHAEIVSRAEEFMRVVFDETGWGSSLDASGDLGKIIDDFKVVSLSYSRPAPSPGDQRREKLSSIPLLQSTSQGAVYLTVQFNYRGSHRGMPWPVYLLGTNWPWTTRDCPTDVNWMLIQAAGEKPETTTNTGTTSPAVTLPAAPDEKSWWDKLPTTGAGGAVRDVADFTGDLTKLAGMALGVYMVVQAINLARPFVTAHKTLKAKN